MAISGFNPQTGEWENLAPPRLNRRAPTGFNPQTGEWESGHVARPMSRSSFTQTSSTTTSTSAAGIRRSSSFWSRLNNGVAHIGNWFADISDDFRDKAEIILIWMFIILGVVGLILLWVNSGFWWALIAGVVLGYIYLGLTGLASAIMSWLLFIPIAILRYVFYNCWTLLITIAIVIGVNVANSSLWEQLSPTPTEQTEATTTTTRYCTASSVLNVRRSPSTNSEIIGVIYRGQAVSVYKEQNGFYEIDFNETRGYASAAYLSETPIK